MHPFTCAVQSPLELGSSEAGGTGLSPTLHHVYMAFTFSWLATRWCLYGCSSPSTTQALIEAEVQLPWHHAIEWISAVDLPLPRSHAVLLVAAWRSACMPTPLLPRLRRSCPVPSLWSKCCHRHLEAGRTPLLRQCAPAYNSSYRPLPLYFAQPANRGIGICIR